MGCVSSKMAAEDRRAESKGARSDLLNHVVSLTSTTYGLLKLDPDEPAQPKQSSFRRISIRSAGDSSFRRFLASPKDPPPETVINTWELMQDLTDDDKADGTPVQTPPGKENIGVGPPEKAPLPDPSRVLKPIEIKPLLPAPDPIRALKPIEIKPLPPPPVSPKSGFSSGKKSGSPVFEPELAALFEKELRCCGEDDDAQIKQVISVSPSPTRLRRRSAPPGGEVAAVLYTTTLRGIRKTFDECNAVRAAVESHGARVREKDVSMDGGFREELRRLRGAARVPALFVGGKFVGGAEEVLKMEEEGRLGKALAGVARARGGEEGCEGCGGVRFVLCMECSGSRKVFDEREKRTRRCAECNENGLILCPLCA